MGTEREISRIGVMIERSLILAIACPKTEFPAMGLEELPGAELIVSGLADLHEGKSDTVGALLIAIASIRLTNAGLDIPKEHLATEPELKLYDRLQAEREDAYPYYNALLDRLNSFCHALELQTYLFVNRNK
ncbi:unknown protein [Leptolyngbya sp. NIES-3755]|nr:unknown protein [Leptolyngbya sp. NIES-3755]